MTTYVYVQNHTAHEFSVQKSMRQAPRHPLPIGSFEWNTERIEPMRRTKLLQFDRARGVHRGSRYEFHSAITLRGQSVDLRQQMQGTLLHSKLWCSAADHPWYDDEDWHTHRWALPSGPIEVVYRSYGTGGDNDVEYVLNPLWPPNPTFDTFNVLAYNVYMRPHFLLKNGQYIRARLLPPRIDDYDVLVLSEVFDDDVRERLAERLGPTYPHRTLVAGVDRAWEQDGGVMIVSRWPIQVRDRLSFHDQQFRPITDCRGDDCHADKGAVYAQIAKEERTFHVFGTHLQAGSSREDALVRAGQLLVIRDWMDSKAIPSTETVIVAGDMNVDRGSREYTGMLALLSAVDPPSSGHPFTVDPVTNELSGSDRQANLDYVLLSARHRLPMASSVETRAIRSASGWKEFPHEPRIWDLSDHFPVYGRLTFGRPAALIAPLALTFGHVNAIELPTTHVDGLTVSSVGTGPVTIRGVRVVGPQAEAFTVTPGPPPGGFPVALPPGESFPIGVTFRGLAEGRYMARVMVTSDDVEGLPGEFHALVTAEVIVPDMSVLPTSIAFGPVAVGQHVTRNVLVTNYGSAPLLFRVEPPAQTALPGFTWSGDEIGTRRVLHPGEDLVVAVRFQPPGPADYSARLTVSGADGTAHVTLSGRGLT